YGDRNWLELSAALSQSESFPLYRASLAAAFNQNSRFTERQLLAVIKAAPRSEDAYEAYEQLSHLYLRQGQYHSLISIMDRRWAAFPGKLNENASEKASLGVFSDLPDQIVSRFQPSTLPHESGDIAIPISIDNNPATYFLDTGASVSVIGES